jgi:acetyl-CoA C-acetyltransferase
LRDVYIVGAGATPVTRETGSSVKDLGGEACRRALAHVGETPIDLLVVGNMLSGMLCRQVQLGAVIADELGLSGIEAISVEAACGSGAAALRYAHVALAGGAADVALVCGVERMTHAGADETTRALATATDWAREGARGETFLSLNAQLMARYLERHDLDRDAFAVLSTLAHRNAVTSDHACFRTPADAAIYADSRPIQPPLRLLDASPICDGAAAVLLVADTGAWRRLIDDGPAVRIAGSAVATDAVALEDRTDPLMLSAVRRTTESVLAQAGLTRRHVDFYELHDAYTVVAALSLESAGFAAPGQALELAARGVLELDGDLPICTFGGLKARGHPVGATGVYQAVEAWLHLTGQAGENQVPGARIGLIQNLGGAGTTAITHLLERPGVL